MHVEKVSKKVLGTFPVAEPKALDNAATKICVCKSLQAAGATGRASHEFRGKREALRGSSAQVGREIQRRTAWSRWLGSLSYENAQALKQCLQRKTNARSQECLRYWGAGPSLRSGQARVPALRGGVEAWATAFADCRKRCGPFGSSAKADSLRVNQQLVQSGFQLASGKQSESAQTLGELEGGQAALTIELAQEIVRGALALLRITFQAGGNQVAIRIGAETHARYDVVEALHGGCEHAQAVETAAVFAAVDGFA